MERMDEMLGLSDEDEEDACSTSSWPQRRPDPPSPDEIHWQDCDVTIVQKKEEARRDIVSLIDHWCWLYPHSQWVRGAKETTSAVMESHSLLRQVLPFVRHVKNLDGEVWHRVFEQVGDDPRHFRATDRWEKIVYPQTKEDVCSMQ